MSTDAYICIYLINVTISVQLLHPVRLFATLWTAALPDFPVLPWPGPSQSSLKLMPVELVIRYSFFGLVQKNVATYARCYLDCNL